MRPPVDFSPQFSKIFFSLMIILHGAAIGAMIISTAPGWLIAGAITFLMVSVWHSLKYQQNRVIRLQQSESLWWLTLRTGERVVVEQPRVCYLTSWLILLNFRAIDSKKRYTVCLFADSIAIQEWRYLRLVLMQGIG